ncbi:hybrid sensor histidine kinase/response regulator [Lysobacter antibioticus]|uniref:hybrid sensor histidine kinase/response regulator n=1 Tax=Lysobacter antibioticus TaxID=84531 RepID=UPI0003468E22|nr:PAS-domain containing protein [Lysobacter antibioticus]
MLNHPRQLRNALWLILIVAGGLLSAWVAGRVAYSQALLRQAGEARALLGQRAQVIEQHIDRYRIMPAVLSLDPQLRATLANPNDRTQRQRANERLVQLNFANRTSTLTLIDAAGIGIAASNWNLANSNVGHSYAFRPYFQRAMTQGAGEFYAIGVTTHVPGHFIARAVHDERGGAVGAVAVKVELEDIRSDWSERGDLVLLSDANGVVFLSAHPQWRYRVLAPQTPAQQRELRLTRQYQGQRLQAAAFRVQREVGEGARVVRLRDPAMREPMLWQSLHLPRENWTLHLLRDTTPSLRTAWIARLVAAGAWLLMVSVVLLILQRNRIAALRLRSRQELEKMVELHAEALRNAGDGVVQAAQASLGESQSLEHLPQGISVVDAQLRLVAWNRRYAELFRYPPELLQVGRPIEDLIRYNARRGLLGNEPEEAIRRRLEHLQRGQPYLHERERPDGTVIEIRGNPMPDGGFVTSYADITAYKQAARDLRSLADSLERGIEQRTSDLQAAKGDAERANRYKTRFVAAAVHDLLQPLNAARMYLSSLRRRVDPDSRELADRIEAALTAQDDILSSLLDISRLESGALEVRRGALPLARVFDAIEGQFRILAESHGLRLHCIASSAIVDSDEVLLRRIVQNFLSNALQFTPRAGCIVLGARRLRDGVRIEIWDTGPGIPEAKRELIFEEFQRLDVGVEAPARGAGLGLAIVRRVAQLLDHRIAVRSWPGRGSVFSVEVPYARQAPVEAAAVPASAAAPEPDSALHGRRVWVVDDDPHSRQAAQGLLADWGCAVEAAGSAAEARARAVEAPMPELLLLDYRLGESTGFELAAQLEALWQRLPPVVLMSADAGPGLRPRASERGWHFLPKPLKPAALRALAMRLLARGE